MIKISHIIKLKNTMNFSPVFAFVSINFHTTVPLYTVFT
jgi:hypothetical protein